MSHENIQRPTSFAPASTTTAWVDGSVLQNAMQEHWKPPCAALLTAASPARGAWPARQLGTPPVVAEHLVPGFPAQKALTEPRQEHSHGGQQCQPAADAEPAGLDGRWSCGKTELVLAGAGVPGRPAQGAARR